MKFVIRYNREREQEEIENFLREHPDYQLVEIRNTLEGDFLVFGLKSEVEVEEAKRELQRLKEEFVEKLMLDEDITEVKEKIKKLKEKFKVYEI